MALALDQRADRDDERPRHAERAFQGRTIQRREAIKVDAGAVDADAVRRQAERRHVALHRFRHREHPGSRAPGGDHLAAGRPLPPMMDIGRSEEHTSELQSLKRISYAVSSLKKKKNKTY